MNDTTTTATSNLGSCTVSGYYPSYSCFCNERLPCGLCKILKEQCPKLCSTITYTTNTTDSATISANDCKKPDGVITINGVNP